MRAPLLGDVVASARALRAVDPEERRELLDLLFEEASAAERHGQETGMIHPRFGDGSLMAAALTCPCVREPGLDDGDYCRCLALVFTTLAEHPCRGSRSSRS
jgi:class 3 adenylate cyclase